MYAPERRASRSSLSSRSISSTSSSLLRRPPRLTDQSQRGRKPIGSTRELVGFASALIGASPVVD
jgi:hypothetical protein